jgi:poly [ADP-ribose] polymerase 2/3/4
VHIDDKGVVYDACLNQTNITGSNNNNKVRKTDPFRDSSLIKQFYLIQLIKAPKGTSYFCHTRWGRVGETGKSNTNMHGSLEDAMTDFGKKFKEKTGLKWEDRGDTPKEKKYKYLAKTYDVQEEPEVEVQDNKPVIESKLPPQSQELMKFIFNDDHFQTTMKQMGFVCQIIVVLETGSADNDIEQRETPTWQIVQSYSQGRFRNPQTAR